MTTYEVIDPLTGSRWKGDLKKLSRNLKINALLCSVSEDGARTNLGLILQRDVVFFTLQWAKSVIKDLVPEVLKCFELTEKWLEDEDSVTKEELRSAAYVADYPADAAAYAASTPADAAHHAADAAANAAYAYVYDANANAALASVTYASQGQMIVDYYESSCANLSTV